MLYLCMSFTLPLRDSKFGFSWLSPIAATLQHFFLMTQCYEGGQKHLGFKFCFLHLQVCNLESYVASLCLSFLLYKKREYLLHMVFFKNQVNLHLKHFHAWHLVSAHLWVLWIYISGFQILMENHQELVEVQIPRCRIQILWFIRYKKQPRNLSFKKLDQMLQIVYRLYSEKSSYKGCFLHKYFTGPKGQQVGKLALRRP